MKNKILFKKYDRSSVIMLGKKWMILIIFVLLLLQFPPSTSAQTSPIIISNNPNFIEEFENPITLNWSVTDDNLREHRIYQGDNLLDYAFYNFSVLRTFDITLEFTLGVGRYNFTMWVIDGNNNTAAHTDEILKGHEASELPELPYYHSSFGLITIIMLIQYKKSRM